MEKRHAYLRTYIGGNPWFCLLFIIGWILLGCIRTGMQDLAPEDFFFFLSRGFSYQKFNLAEFLYYLFFYIYPLFWINVFLEQEKKDRNLFARFRYASVEKWNRTVAGICFRYILSYYGQFTICVILGVLALNGMDHGAKSIYVQAIGQQYGMGTQEIYIGFAISFIWRILELCLLLEINLLLFHGLRSTLPAFLGTFLVYLLGAVLRSRNILIAGLAASYGIFEIMGQGHRKALVLNLLSGLVLTVLLFVIQRRILCKADKSCLR